MKTIEEIGISPRPWEVTDNACVGWVDDNNELNELCDCWGHRAEANANFIAAAPKLYECLREAVVQTCLYCKYKKCAECKVVNKWKSALAKAAGEEMEK